MTTAQACILVGVDFSLESRAALDVPIRLACEQETLAAWAARRRAAGVEMDARVVEGRPETALVEVAKNTHCDWIVVGVQGRTALAELLIGKTTDRVLKLADRPVLTVPSTTVSPGEVTS